MVPRVLGGSVPSILAHGWDERQPTARKVESGEREEERRRVVMVAHERGWWLLYSDDDLFYRTQTAQGPINRRGGVPFSSPTVDTAGEDTAVVGIAGKDTAVVGIVGKDTAAGLGSRPEAPPHSQRARLVARLVHRHNSEGRMRERHRGRCRTAGLRCRSHQMVERRRTAEAAAGHRAATEVGTVAWAVARTDLTEAGSRRAAAVMDSLEERRGRCSDRDQTHREQGLTRREPDQFRTGRPCWNTAA